MCTPCVVATAAVNPESVAARVTVVVVVLVVVVGSTAVRRFTIPMVSGSKKLPDSYCV
jgi:hypothetical protein